MEPSTFPIFKFNGGIGIQLPRTFTRRFFSWGGGGMTVVKGKIIIRKYFTHQLPELDSAACYGCYFTMILFTWEVSIFYINVMLFIVR
jgi:hypothetical protein